MIYILCDLILSISNNVRVIRIFLHVVPHCSCIMVGLKVPLIIAEIGLIEFYSSEAMYFVFLKLSRLVIDSYPVQGRVE